MEKAINKKDKENLKAKWLKYLCNSKLSDYEADRRATWHSFHEDKVPKE